MAAAALALPASASAVTRYAAPGGSATAAACVTPEAAPCSISEAAEGTGVANGDEVVIAPGSYSDTAGDLGADVVNPVAEIHVHGDPAAPPPVITLNTSFSFGAFLISDGQKLSHVRIETDAADSGLSAFGGVVEGVIVISRKDSGLFACSHSPGLDPAIIRDSVCLSSGDSTDALGADVGTFAGTHPAVLRNVTAIATGTGSDGISYRAYGAGVDWNVDAKSVIADGATDVFAGGFNAADTSIVLDASNYATTGTGTSMGGVASVTAPGSGSNQTAAPVLASDGFHQLASSPTIGNGATDASSGAADIDGQNRSIPAGDPDIGADELGNPTSTALACVPDSLMLGSGGSTCTATVTDTAVSPLTPSGAVSFSSDAGGAFSAPSCVLSGGGASAACQVDYTPSALGGGSHEITAGFPAGGSHEASEGSDQIAVAEPPDGTATSVSCSPSPVTLGSAASCTAEVASTSPPGFPTGSVSFTASGPGGTLSAPGCTLAALTGKSRCKVSFTPWALGAHRLTASYAGAAGFEASAGAATLQAVARQAKKCKKRKAKKRAAGSAKKRKCKKKRKKKGK